VEKIYEGGKDSLGVVASMTMMFRLRRRRRRRWRMMMMRLTWIIG
jgi:hypothetical protein